MSHTKDIDTCCKTYIKQSLYLYVALFLLGLLVAQVGRLEGLLTPLVVGVLFALVIETVEAQVWKRVAKRSVDGLPAFFMATSGFRFLLALAVMFVYFLFTGRASMLLFVLVFAVFYVAMLVHHALFFSIRGENT